MEINIELSHKKIDESHSRYNTFGSRACIISVRYVTIAGLVMKIIVQRCDNNEVIHAVVCFIDIS